MAFNPGSGWERMHNELADKMQAAAVVARDAGRISSPVAAHVEQQIAALRAKADTYKGRTALQTITKGLPKVGTVALGATAGVLTGGVGTAGIIAAASGFLGAAGVASGITPSVDVSTPPIVGPQPAPPPPPPTRPVSIDGSGPHPALILLGWVGILYVLLRRKRR